MYIEIHPFFYDSFSVANDVHSGIKKQECEYYRQTKPRVIRLESIQQVIPQPCFDNSATFALLKFNDVPEDNLFVSEFEGEKIKRELLKLGQEQNVSKKLDTIITMFENLHELLCQRL